MLSLFKNIIEKLKVNITLVFQNLFNRINSPVNKTTITTNIFVDKLTQNNAFIGNREEIPQLNEEGSQSIEKLKILTSHLTAGSSDSLIVSEEDKKKINSRIDEAVALMNLNRLEEARDSFLITLGEIKNNSQYKKEQVRIYNNLGAIYSRPTPEGNYDEAIKYFHEALNIDPEFVKAKMNIALTYINKSDEESVGKGYDLIKVLWLTEKTAEVLQVFLWGVYKKEKRGDKAIELIEKEKTVMEPLISEKDSLLNLVAGFYLESGKVEDAIKYNDKALALSPEEPSFIAMKARILMIKAQNNYMIPSEFDIIPKFRDYEDVKESLTLFNKALNIAEKQKMDYLIPEIRYGISTCSLWLGKYDEAKYSLQQIKSQELPTYPIDILNFANYLHERNFEIAYNTLKNSNNYPKINYQEKKRIARIFLLNGAPEQAELLFDEIVLEAEQKKDIYYWLDLSAVYLLLGKHQEAISAATKAKKLSEGMDNKIRKIAFSHYNAVNYHYSKPEGGEDSETDRLLLGMMEFQSEFPDEKIITPIKALNEQGQLTAEVKDMFTSTRERYEKIREIFKKGPILTYYLEEIFHRPFASEITFRSDPEFTIEFTAVDPASLDEFKNNFLNSKTLIFDYLSLLDLAKMDFLGFLEKLGKPIFIHEKLFQKIQNELLQGEIVELRTLWNFLRKSKVVQILREKANVKLKSEKLDDVFDEWLIETIKYAKTQEATLVTNDFRLYRFLKSEEIKPLNIMPILKFWLERNWIDKTMFSRAIGDLAERFYVFLSYTGEDLFEIVLEDKGKITLRSYHLVREVFLPGSNIESFMRVFAQFIYLFWRTGSLSEEKVNWIKFFTKTITQIIDKEFIPLKGKIVDKENFEIIREQFKQKFEPMTTHFAIIWNTAIQNGTRDDLIALEKIIDETMEQPYLLPAKEKMRVKINQRLAELTPK